MSEVVIRVNSLAKRYRIGVSSPRSSMRERLTHTLTAPVRWLSSRPTSAVATSRTFWALRDVSFELKQGEVLGLIGRNGAGKSTLLKILSRVTQPTEGNAEIHGRVGSLLEVGTGFHPELTGRENTYLNGAILGMGKREINRKFDEIVEFAGVADFIDTPLKHYSSGMQMRLAFAVAAHLEPEILLVDEVLAVGDISFQKKCLGKMGDVARDGRTVVLVSHNMGAIGQLCQRCLVLEKGNVAMDASPEKAIALYMKSNNARGDSKNQSENWDRSGNQIARITTVELFDDQGTPCSVVPMGMDLCLRVSGTADTAGLEFGLSVQFIAQNGTPVLWLYDHYQNFRSAQDRSFLIEIRMPEILLMPGTYYLSLWIGREGQEAFDHIKNALEIDVLQSDNIPVTATLRSDLGLVYGHLTSEQLR